MLNWKQSAILLAACTIAPSVTRAQSADTTHRFSIFGGVRHYDSGETTKIFPERAVGASADFRLNGFPLMLRTSVAFSEVSPTFHWGIQRIGTLALDAVAHPIAGIAGVHPYLIAGLGAATAAPFELFQPAYASVDNQFVLTSDSRVVTVRRNNWAFVEGGGGLEFGKFFIEAKLQEPAASGGPVRKPISFGFHF